MIATSRLPSLLLFVTVGLLAACERPGTYPGSGAECHEGDPVRDLDKADFDIPCP